MNKTSNGSSGGKGQGRLALMLVVAAVIVFGASGWAWWHSIRSNPERTFYGALENNLRTRSVTRQVEQSSGSQKLTQGVELSLSPKAVAHGFTTMSQSGQVNASVKTEIVSKATEEYVRYTAIDTDQKGTAGTPLNFKDLLNIWGKSSTEQTGQPGELYGESVLGVVPTANLGAHNRQALMKLIREKKVYDFNEQKLERKIQNGRPTYIYNVTVAPQAYIALLKDFGGMTGLKQLESLDPEQYKGAQPLTFRLTVDVWGQKLTAVEYAGGVRTERVGSYGMHHDVDVPKSSIPTEELQAKLQQVQQ
jgi:hypothetical protein